MMHLHYSLVCPGFHGIPIPRPSHLGTGANLPVNSTRKAIVACPECGRVSLHWERDIQETPAPMLDLFEAGEAHLVYISIECDRKGCESPTEVHTIIASGEGTWKQKVDPKDWKFLPDARCDNGDQLIGKWTEFDHIAWKTSKLWSL